MAGPLSHIRVLDLSRIMAGPWASQILADLGADVIKVERPEVGDDTRSWGPPFLSDKDGNLTEDAGYFLSVNRGKRSICLDIATAEGQAAVRQLAQHSDIVIENFKTGALTRYGLDALSLRSINPRLIYASVTGFGQDGPRAGQVAYDFMIQAMGGLMSITGVPDGQPGGGPQKVGVPIVDLMTGMYTAVAVLAALSRRDVTGAGDNIDIAMLDVMSATLANQAMNSFLSGKVPTRTGNAHPNIQPQDVYPCGEGHIVIAVGNDGQFTKFADAIGLPALAQDARFARNADRVRHLSDLNTFIIHALSAHPMQHWVTRLEAAGVPCGPINTIKDVFADAQLRHREMVQMLPHSKAGQVPSVVSPMRFSEAPLAFEKGPPVLGEHSNEIIKEFSLGCQIHPA